MFFPKVSAKAPIIRPHLPLQQLEELADVGENVEEETGGTTMEGKIAKKNERNTGLEPATLGLGSQCSTN